MKTIKDRIAATLGVASAGKYWFGGIQVGCHARLDRTEPMFQPFSVWFLHANVAIGSLHLWVRFPVWLAKYLPRSGHEFDAMGYLVGSQATLALDSLLNKLLDGATKLKPEERVVDWGQTTPKGRKRRIRK